ncbi:MAG: 1-deoxy-D-xylulose-5-phosphate synthase [Bacilli bacterium]
MKHNDQKKIDYNALKGLENPQLKVLASDIRSTILSATLRNGGHLSSNLGTVELTMSLLRHFDPLESDILFDVGHQEYTYKILTGRDLYSLRQTGGIAPFSSIDESKYDKFNNGHAGTALGCAHGMAIAKNLQLDNSYTIAVIGDGSMTNGLTLESLNLLVTDKPKRLIVVINDNGMSIGKNVGFMTKKFQNLRNSRLYFRTSSFLGRKMAKNRFSWRLFVIMRNLKDKFKSFVLKPTVFEAMGLKYLGPYDGHDFDSLDLAFDKAKYVSANGPVVLHILTKKGYGYPPATEDTSGDFHGVKPNFDCNENISPEDFTEIKCNYFLNRMSTDRSLFFLTAAMEKGCGLEKIFSSYPSRCLDVGIAEENAVTLASGLALKGYNPIIDIYSSFLQRGYDQIMEDISRNKVKATFIVERAGLVGQDGASHHGLYDVSMARSIPNAQVFMPFDKNTTEYILDNLHNSGPLFIRFPKDDPIVNPLDYSISQGLVIFKSNPNNTKMVFATGPLGYRLIEKLYSRNDVNLILLCDLLPSKENLDTMPMDHIQEIYGYDPYGIKEGTGDYLSSYLYHSSFRGSFNFFSFKDEFVTFGKNSDLLKMHSLDVESVYNSIINSLDKKAKAD